MSCDTTPSHTDTDGIPFDIEKKVNCSFDGDTETVMELTALVTAHFRKSGKGKTSGRDSNRNVEGGYSVRFDVFGK